ncbi:MAG: HNH endonuclease signature motif containing protein [Proteobacteria bacterium]|nr:HNH endonuclease signature motif containing protein [Pseudomonadota bacterium]
MRGSKYTRAVLAPIVAEATSLAGVLRALDLPATGGNYRMMGARIRIVGIDIAHFAASTIAARCAAIPRATLEAVIPRCLSVAQVLATLALPLEGRAHRELTRRIRALELDTTHFRGRGWSRGETSASHPSIARANTRKRWSDDAVFVENSTFLDGRGLARRLRAMGRAFRCSWCGIQEWRGAALVLHLDHVNGISNDNRVENLRFLCPNCHSQTETYGNRRR